MADKKRVQDKERILRYLLRNGSVQNTFKRAKRKNGEIRKCNN